MKDSMVSKNYLFGTKICFLILSFIIFTIAITVHHDIWPFLLENLPVDHQPKFWNFLMMLMGVILPAIWLRQDWDNKPLRYGLSSLIVMFILQLVTEAVVAHYFFISMIVPTQILYISYRMLQLVNLQRSVYKVTYPAKMSKTRRSVLVVLTLLFWSIVLFKLMFVTFPQIVPQFF